MTFNQFKQLAKQEHDLFISKLIYAVNKSEGAYQYASTSMELKERMYFKDFLNLPETEKNELISTMLKGIHNNENYFDTADLIVQAGEQTGLYNNVKFGNEVFSSQAIEDVYVSELCAADSLLFSHNKNSRMITDPKGKDGGEETTTTTTTETSTETSSEDDD